MCTPLVCLCQGKRVRSLDLSHSRPPPDHEATARSPLIQCFTLHNNDDDDDDDDDEDNDHDDDDNDNNDDERRLQQY